MVGEQKFRSPGGTGDVMNAHLVSMSIPTFCPISTIATSLFVVHTKLCHIVVLLPTGWLSKHHYLLLTFWVLYGYLPPVVDWLLNNIQFLMLVAW
jgi:hypothetical protein